jgi:hypothetical protein
VSGFEYLGTELVTHEDVAVQIDAHAAHTAGTARHLLGQFRHHGAVRGEMQVGAADSTGSNGNQHLAGFGYRVGHVVPVDHTAVSQHRGAHQLPALSCSATCSVMAFTTAWPARPIKSSRLPLAQS